MSPFLIEQDQVNWSRWLYDSVQILAVVGVDLIMLAGVEYDWVTGITCVRNFLKIMYGGLGLVTLMYSIMSKHSKHGENAYGKGGEFESEPLEATNQFQDVRTSLVFLTVLTIAQVTFVKFYFNQMMTKVEFTAQAYRYFLCAIPMQVVGQGMLGADFCTELRLWNKLLNSPGVGATVQVGDDGSAEVVKVSYASCLIRSMMSFYANNLSIACMFLTLPLFMMSAASDIDFVKDCFAVVFITTIDDLGDAIPLKVLDEEKVEESDAA